MSQPANCCVREAFGEDETEGRVERMRSWVKFGIDSLRRGDRAAERNHTRSDFEIQLSITHGTRKVSSDLSLH